MHVIAIASQKGGVGKTTISLNLGLALARAGNRTLIMELDAQGRLLVPAALRAYAGIERDVVSIGSLTRVELWSKERLVATAPSEDEAAAFMTELGLY